MEELFDEHAARTCPTVPRAAARCGCLSLSVLSVLMIALIAASFDTVPPVNMALCANTLTGYVDTKRVYQPGRWFISLGHKFILFPKTRRSLQFGGPVARGNADTHSFAPPIKARTGPDPADVSGESGGQPLDLSVSLQYRFEPAQIPYVYQMFGPGYEDSFIRFARQAISNKAQEFTPAAFWEERARIEKAMRADVAKALLQQGHALVEDLQLTRVEFSDKYEESILRVQLQEQLVTTKRYNLTVTQVLKGVDILESAKEATVMRISAEAAAEARVIVNTARNAALRLEQTAKASAYKRLKEKLGWSSSQFLEYLKVRAVNAAQSAPGSSENVVVSIDPLGSVARRPGSPAGRP